MLVEVAQNVVFFFRDPPVFAVQPELELSGADLLAKVSLEEKERFVGGRGRREPDDRIAPACSGDLLQARVRPKPRPLSRSRALACRRGPCIIGREMRSPAASSWKLKRPSSHSQLRFTSTLRRGSSRKIVPSR